MIIRSIEVSGEDRRPASLFFAKGLNLIAGPSNTGKSYVIECIKFALGASSVPKPIKESAGYDSVALSIEEDGVVFTLSRRFVVNATTTLTTENGDQVVFKGRHSPNLKNLSNYFLSKIGLNNKLLLLSKEKQTTQALTLRTLESIFVVDEKRIVADYSPLGTGQRTEVTLERSFLKTLLTGVDDSRAKDTRDTDASPELIKRKIKSLEELMRLIFPDSSTPTASADEINDQIAKVDKSITDIDLSVQDLISSKSGLLRYRSENLNQASQLEAEIRDAKALRQRFSLLMEKYGSDRSRVVGVSEAALLLDNYSEINCPTCGSNFDEMASDVDIEIVLQSASAEAKKIDVQMRDLSATIDELNSNIRIATADIEKIKSDVDTIDVEIQSDIGDRLGQLAFTKNGFFQKRIELTSDLARVEGRSSAQIELDKLRNYGDRENVSYEIDDFSDQISLFIGNVEAVLKRWGFPDYSPTKFVDKSRDLEIGGTPRKDFGKGYRAVACSAFVIGLMKTLIVAKRHPGFVVLDSPLTTYKKADIEQGDADESIESDMVYSVYRDLCEAYAENQIIVFDNQEPDLDLIPLMNYQHFTKNVNVGRYGFFPVN